MMRRQVEMRREETQNIHAYAYLGLHVIDPCAEISMVQEMR